ncbi:arginase family protein [Micromonospora chaiyaphumensis]|uniref:Arginase n=1 Tax=Micromonospora chaiyaphumensis TaxID=307119 RepID=A0A1C4X2H3_9ACTN|nr:arginase family protein [Micromonospora chaiyaphumensis]SCF02665.1 arginase [Micromonospora chaiyaphumensis]
MTAQGWYLAGAPWDCSGLGRGERLAPAALRAAGLSELVPDDAGDAPIVIDDDRRDDATGVRALEQTTRAATVLADWLDAAAGRRPGHRPLVVGGDCSLLLGVLPWLRRSRGRVGLWFVDGHPDYLDGPSSPTGETADMDLALLTGSGPERLTAPAGSTAPLVAPADVVLVGHRTRDLDPEAAAEVARLPDSIRRIDAPAVVGAPRRCGERAAALLAGVDGGVWLHVDCDVLDPAAMPAVSYPEPGGPTAGQVADLLAPLVAGPRLLGVSIADFRPDLDPDGTHAATLVELFRRLLPGAGA